jgi:hypothetical protein
MIGDVEIKRPIGTGAASAPATRRVLIHDSLHHWEPDDRLVTKAAGVTFENEDHVRRQAIIVRCKAGDRLMLKPEPGNRFDHNAVAVLTAAGEQIGYLMRERASELAEFFSLHGAIPAVIIQVTGGRPEKPIRGVNIEAEIPPDPENMPVAMPLPSERALPAPQAPSGGRWPLWVAAAIVAGLAIGAAIGSR